MSEKIIITKNINACSNCGTIWVEASHCGLTTFNPGKAVCLKCGKEVPINICELGNEFKSIIKSWNDCNPKPEKIIAFIDKKVKELLKEKKRIKKLFKI